jgi:hypothetical protein
MFAKKTRNYDIAMQISALRQPAAEEAVKKWLPSPQRRRDAEKGPFVFKPLRLRDSAVRRVFGNCFTASEQA